MAVLAPVAFGPPSAVSPLTTKGDLPTFSTTTTRLAVGADFQTLYASAGAATGLLWLTQMGGLIETKGPLQAASAAQTFSPLAGNTDVGYYMNAIVKNDNAGNSVLVFKVNGASWTGQVRLT